MGVAGETPRYVHLAVLVFPGSAFVIFIRQVEIAIRDSSIADTDPFSRLHIDHENTLLHGKTFLSLGAKPSANASTIR
jgi:hypothetical protein